MQTPKKRKTDEVLEHRITYAAPSRLFDRLFKEDTLEEMKDVVRKKLSVATSVPIYLSQVRDGASVDLEDDDDFDAFRAFVRKTQSAHVEVVVGPDTPVTQPLPSGDSEFSSATKKKKSKGNASSSVTSSSVLVDLPPLKRRRVSFLEPPGDEPEQSTVVPAIPDKKSHRRVADASGPPEEELPDTTLPKSATKEGKEKKKRKKTPAAVSEALTLTHTDDTANDAETITETPPTKKRTLEEDTSQVFSPSQPDHVAGGEDNTSRPAKKSKTKHRQTDDEPLPPKNSRSKSVTPASRRGTSIVNLSPAVPSVEPETSIKSKKGKERDVSEPPEQIRHDEASKKKRGKSKIKADVVAEKAAEVKKNKVNLAQQTEVRASDSAIPDQTTKKKEKAAENPQAALPNKTPNKDKDLDEPSSPIELKTPRTRRKTQDTENKQSQEHRRSATMAVIDALLERASPQVPQAAAPSPAPQGATSEEEGEESSQEEEPCPFCDELPTHDRSLCPVIKGGVRTMRKRLGQLEKDTSGDEAKQEKRQQVITDLQLMIQKRARGPRKPKADSAVTASVTQNKGPLPAAPIAEATKTAKQVDVVSPPTRVVDALPPIAPSQSVNSTLSTAKSLKSAKQPSPLQPSSAPQPPSSSQQSVSKTAQDKATTEKLMANLPLVTEPSLVGHVDLPLEDLSQVTDNDLQNIIHGHGVSAADLPSSDEDEEEDEEEPILDGEEDISRRLSQGSLREYPSSSDAEEEDDDSFEGGVSKRKSTSLSTEEEDPTDDIQISEGSSSPGEGDTSFRELDTRGSSREIDNTGDDALEAALTEDFATLNTAINGKRKGGEVDSDTVVGSQVEEIVEQGAKEKRVECTTATTDPIEPPEQVELVVSDDHGDPSKVESIKTRSRRKKDTDEQLGDSVVQAPNTVKKARKITELPVPSFPSVSSVRVMKSSISGARRGRATTVRGDHETKISDEEGADRSRKPSKNGKVGSKAPIKETKRTNARSKTATNETPQGRAPTKNVSRVSVANGTGPAELVAAINKASEVGNITGSQWAVLEESNPLMETPGQVDELLSDVASQVDQTPLIVKQSQDRDPLFLPSATPQSFPYSQFSEIFTPRGGPSHESEDENEVLASVVKPAHPVRTYRSLSQIASSQTFTTPNFQLANFGKTKEPASLYGRNRRDAASETDSSSESDEDRPAASHIPASRRAGLPFMQK